MNCQKTAQSANAPGCPSRDHTLTCLARTVTAAAEQRIGESHHPRNSDLYGDRKARINLANLHKNIEPTRERTRLVLVKGRSTSWSGCCCGDCEV
jgi:hypothetical protein